ncbi:glycoside hydrolase family 43 protein [Saccharothrix deserti]|uniref:glycoside hydrolase family 43 protein n=1 Tax=Saccharothrix deserti TaxID=2593674 RepID=UPI00192E2FE5|nr:glycoside hydrolase family 43 protein [Saccharothrix deserti]
MTFVRGMPGESHGVPGAACGRRTLLKAGLAGLAIPVLPGLFGTAEAAVPPSGTTARYTMTTFTYAAENTVHVYDSVDATAFRLLKGPAYTPPTGLSRDPSIMRHTDGRYYLTYTASWTGNQIGLASSTDRVNWAFLGNITIPGTGIGNSWAPEWFIDTDGSVNIIVSLHFNGAPNGTFQPYKITATDAGLTAWSAPAPLTGIPAAYIDTFIVKIGSTYHAFCKSTSTRSIDFATAGSLTGPYTIWKTANFVDYDGEGPTAVPLDNGGWRLFFEDYRNRRFWFTDSRDTFRTWSPPVLLPGLSGTVKHLTVPRENVPGGPTLPTGPRVLRSVNFPDRYWNADGGLGTTRTTFTIVPGLADPNGYSFRAADGRYLRHYAFGLRMDTGSGTVFAEDATFVARPGAVNGSVALESFNFPGRYIRHRDYSLWVDPHTNTDLFRQDSSFTAIAP